MTRRAVWTVALVAVVQLALMAIAVAPQLSARVAGTEYRLLVQPVDPIDPFRGAYVDLDYPGLQVDRRGASGDLFVVLEEEEEDGLWQVATTSRQRPQDGVYLACDDSQWRLRCGIESWFVPQDEARELEQTVARDGAIATIKVDARGNAAIVALDPR